MPWKVLDAEICRNIRHSCASGVTLPCHHHNNTVVRDSPTSALGPRQISAEPRHAWSFNEILEILDSTENAEKQGESNYFLETLKKSGMSRDLLSGPVLRDTARLSQRYPPIALPFSECFPLGEHAKWRCDTPPQKGYLSDTHAIPYENKANGCDTPLCDTISKGYCAIWGGISQWAAKETFTLKRPLFT